MEFGDFSKDEVGRKRRGEKVNGCRIRNR